MRGFNMSYPVALILCVLLMGAIACVLYYFGQKISYSYNLYNPTISLGFGVIFLLTKMIISHQNSVEFSIDLILTAVLLFVWLIALFEAVIIDVFETGEGMLKDLRLLISKIKLKERIVILISTVQHWKRLLGKNKKTT